MQVCNPRLWLCFPPAALALLDHGVTLAWQPHGYWRGHFGLANEGNVLYGWLLGQHPLAFEAGMVAWIALFSAVILGAPRRLAQTVAVAVAMGHSWGLSTWLVNRVSFGYWCALGLYLVTAFGIVQSWDRFRADVMVDGPPNSQ